MIMHPIIKEQQDKADKIRPILIANGFEQGWVDSPTGHYEVFYKSFNKRLYEVYMSSLACTNRTVAYSLKSLEQGIQEIKPKFKLKSGDIDLG